jgi:transcriptional regulator with XRE-family HTH domain
MSKYENGYELPKLDTLSRLLTELGIGLVEFFYIVRVLDRLEAGLGTESKPSLDLLMLEEMQFLEPAVKNSFQGLLGNILELFKLLMNVQVSRGAKR